MCLLKLSIIRIFFSVSIKSIVFLKITNSSILILEKIYNFIIATFNSFVSFLYICITILEFDFTTFIDLDFENFDFANFTNFNFAILNILIEDKLRSLFYNISILI